MNEDLTLTANQALILQKGDGAMTEDQLAAPVAHTQGAGVGHSGVEPGAGCALWDVKWENGSLLVFSCKIGQVPNFARLYEAVFKQPAKK